jgi:hypothetical protein
MSPGAGIVGPGVFFPGASYDLLISNDGNPLTDEIIFRTTFSPPDASGRQRYEVRRGGASDPGAVVASGVTNSRPANIRGGGRVTAGLFDDPFFFDLQGLKDTRATGTIMFKNTRSAFANANITGVVIQIPRSRIEIPGKQIDIWSETGRIGGQL